MGASREIAGKVRVELSAVEFQVERGENIRAAAIRNGFRWPSTCGGLASCTLCSIEVIEGSEFLGPIFDREAEALKRLKITMANFTENYRLACQSTITGDIVVKKRGVRLISPAVAVNSE